jgi:recombinational DNA repair protein RecR
LAWLKRIKSLVERIGAGAIEEIVAATDPLWKARPRRVSFEPAEAVRVKVARMAMEIPVGNDIEFADLAAVDDVVERTHAFAEDRNRCATDLE